MDPGYIYQEIRTILVFCCDSYSEQDYTVTIYNNSSNKSVKIILINSNNEQESYTANITSDLYTEMKEEQQLIIEFTEFANELKTVLSNMATSDIVIKLHVDNVIQLGFYKPSELKELTLLEVPFTKTSAEEMISYFKKKAQKLLESHALVLSTNQLLEKQITDMKKHQEAYINKLVEHSKQVESKLQGQIDELQKECNEKDAFFNECVRERELIVERRNTLRDENERLKELTKQHGSDIEKLREGVEYFKDKAETLKEELIAKNATMVPNEKYEKLGTVFSSAIADLIKSQIKLYEVVSLNDLQKSENKALKEELSKSANTIKELERSFDKDYLKLESSEILEVAGMIEQLQIQNEMAEKVNSMLNQKFKEDEHRNS